MQSSYHIPVLMREVLEYMDPQPHGVYVDVTFGGGGHTRALLEKEPTCKVIALDWDAKAIESNATALEKEFGERFQVIWSNFAQLKYALKKINVKTVDGILADFGTSQHQIKERAGFSFSVETPLDMRMSPAHQMTTAAQLLQYASPEELISIFHDYGEEPHARAIVRAISEQRKKKPLKTTNDLAELVISVVGRKGRIHPATRVFQALRIYVNRELENISSFLSQTMPLLKPQARLVCISFHSLEDRLVKQFLKKEQTYFSTLTKKVIMAQPDELLRNPSSRSAKLRAAERTALEYSVDLF